MRKFNKIIAIMLSLICILGVAVNTQAKDINSYPVILKVGSRGTLQDGKKSMKLGEGEINFKQAYELVEPKDGYYLSGWNVGTKEYDVNADNVSVKKKTIMVAQYRKIIKEAVYRVKYVDNFGEDVATQKVIVIQRGAEVIEEALDVKGYKVDKEYKSATVSKKGTEIVFTYTSTKDK